MQVRAGVEGVGGDVLLLCTPVMEAEATRISRTGTDENLATRLLSLRALTTDWSLAWLQEWTCVRGREGGRKRKGKERRDGE